MSSCVSLITFSISVIFLTISPPNPAGIAPLTVSPTFSSCAFASAKSLLKCPNLLDTNSEVSFDRSFALPAETDVSLAMCTNSPSFFVVSPSGASVSPSSFFSTAAIASAVLARGEREGSRGTIGSEGGCAPREIS